MPDSRSVGRRGERPAPQIDDRAAALVGRATDRWVEDRAVDLRLDRLHEQHGRQRRLGAAGIEAAQMELHFAGEYLFELAQTLDALGCARRLIEQQPRWARDGHVAVRGAGGSAGFDVQVPDLPGYGHTGVPSPRGIRYSDWVDCVTDLVRAAKSADPRPLVLVGASMGGMLAYAAAARTGMADALAATCLVDRRLVDPRLPQVRAAIARHRWLGRYGTRLLIPALDRLRVPVRLLANMSAISSDPRLNRVVWTDRHGGGSWMPLGFLRTYLRSAPSVEPEEFTACTVWLMHPGADRWTPLSLSQAFFDRIAAPKRLIVLDTAAHYPVEPPGIYQPAEAFAEIRHQLVTGPVADR
ncbi:alpha/beta fold hydrolase [Nocardia beijingensis]|uniref:alpha/beta hydrolase n=1 Tax=Nocardia beijingensis TaxID=95162 RepID=UPI001894AEFE|nr:alpha/beta fold hydrolase [Nocardia beijingensis]MBF6465761.1 alpha/beta fold hydrolase [Nocardia beijingensis]